MKEEISVDKAINRGHLMVNVPVFITIIGCPVLSIYLSDKNLIPKWGILFGFILGFVLAWLLWSFMITKWRIWAFENVRNVHELKKRAIQEKLIWNDENIFEKTEIRSYEDKLKLKKLEKKFEKKDEFKEDFSLPLKTEIYYSKTTSYIEIGIAFLITGVGSYLLSFGETKYYVLGTILILIALKSLYDEFKKTSYKKPIIIIDSKGIMTKNVDFKNWSSITNEEVIQEGYGKSTKSFLFYNYDEYQYEKIEINSLDVTHKQLENIIRTYRIRFNKTSS